MVARGDSNVSCRNMKKLIVGHYLHMLSGKEKEFAENHLKHCEKCRLKLGSLEVATRLSVIVDELKRKGIKIDNLKDEFESIRPHLPDLAEKVNLTPKQIESLLIRHAEHLQKYFKS